MKIRVKKVSGDPFKIPGTQIKIYTIQDETGQIHKTMSGVIAKEGWEGEVEEYTNENKNAYLRQPKKDGDYASPSGGESKASSKYEEGAAFGNATTNATNLVIGFNGTVPDTIIEEVARVRDRLLGTREEIVEDEKYREEHLQTIPNKIVGGTEEEPDLTDLPF